MRIIKILVLHVEQTILLSYISRKGRNRIVCIRNGLPRQICRKFRTLRGIPVSFLKPCCMTSHYFVLEQLLLPRGDERPHYIAIGQAQSCRKLTPGNFG